MTRRLMRKNGCLNMKKLKIVTKEDKFSFKKFILFIFFAMNNELPLN